MAPTRRRWGGGPESEPVATRGDGGADHPTHTHTHTHTAAEHTAPKPRTHRHPPPPRHHRDQRPDQARQAAKAPRARA
eukprot:12871509-Alexandrium_andersonii.AAC.1